MTIRIFKALTCIMVLLVLSAGGLPSFKQFTYFLSLLDISSPRP